MLTDLQRIEHMIENAELLISFAANLTETEYASSVEKQYAMKFAFVMLGEDAALISNELKLKYPNIPWNNSNTQIQYTGLCLCDSNVPTKSQL